MGAASAAAAAAGLGQGDGRGRAEAAEAEAMRPGSSRRQRACSGELHRSPAGRPKSTAKVCGKKKGAEKRGGGAGAAASSGAIKQEAHCGSVRPRRHGARVARSRACACAGGLHGCRANARALCQVVLRVRWWVFRAKRAGQAAS
eukprot:2427736-Prymnesium_polylepis.1